MNWKKTRNLTIVALISGISGIVLTLCFVRWQTPPLDSVGDRLFIALGQQPSNHKPNYRNWSYDNTHYLKIPIGGSKPDRKTSIFFKCKINSYKKDIDLESYLVPDPSFHPLLDKAEKMRAGWLQVQVSIMIDERHVYSALHFWDGLAIEIDGGRWITEALLPTDRQLGLLVVRVHTLQPFQWNMRTSVVGIGEFLKSCRELYSSVEEAEKSEMNK